MTWAVYRDKAGKLHAELEQFVPSDGTLVLGGLADASAAAWERRKLEESAAFSAALDSSQLDLFGGEESEP